MSNMIEINLKPDERTLRQFGLIAAVGFGLLAVIAWLELLIFAWGLGESRPLVSGTFCGLGLVSLLCSLTYPRANLALYLSLTVVSYPIGFVLSHLVMRVLFYGLISPVGLFFRLIGRDPLERRFEADASSYWRPARPRDSKESYFRQF